MRFTTGDWDLTHDKDHLVKPPEVRTVYRVDFASPDLATKQDLDAMKNEIINRIVQGPARGTRDASSPARNAVSRNVK